MPVQGTAAWMEGRKPMQVLSQKKHTRGRRDRMFDAMLRHAPREVSDVLGIPMAKVQVLERKVAKRMVRQFKAERKAQQMHAVHRGMLKGACVRASLWARRVSAVHAGGACWQWSSLLRNKGGGGGRLWVDDAGGSGQCDGHDRV